MLIIGSPSQIPLNRSRAPLGRVVRPIYRYTVKKTGQHLIFYSASQLDNSWTERVRCWYSAILQKELTDPSAIALIETLLLGRKNPLPVTLSKAYAATGTMHILAVSGLHVGMIYGFVHILLGCLPIKRKGIKTTFALIILWLYAWLCNFIPSMLRAAIMLTLAQISLHIGRRSDSYNDLWSSAFILLVTEPLLLLNLGFQLSYIATLGILYLQPRLQQMIIFKNCWLQKIGQTTALSIAAYISTLLLILYHFKQIPLYFIFTNWFMLPAIYIIIALSFGLAVAHYLPLLGSLIGFILTIFIGIMHKWIYQIAAWPISTLNGFTVNGYLVFLLYCILIAACLFF